MKKMKTDSSIAGVFACDLSTDHEIELYTTKVSAGFPSPADDFIERKLDLNRFLVKHPAATFFVRVSGESMMNAGISDGDILVVDRSLNPMDKKIVIASVNSELTVKRIRKVGTEVFLVPENDQYSPIKISDGMEFSVWGVVTASIRVQ